MDKTEYKIKLDEINKLVDEEKYEEAVKVADTIDWKRVKSVRTLSMVGEIYEANKRYKEAKEVLLLAYERAPIGKTILYRLVDIAIRLGEFDNAVDYYTEFSEVAPHDNSKYVLKYKIYKARRSPIEEQISILEEYKDREYTERWAYELAKLYDKAEMRDKCVQECDDMILWFGEGTYVYKAMELKMKYTALTPSQRKVYENRFQEEEKEKEAEKEKLSPKEEMEENLEKIHQAGAAIADGAHTAEGESASEESDEDSEKSSAAESSMPQRTVLEDAGNLQNKLVQSIRNVFSGGAKEESGEDEQIEVPPDLLAEDEEEEELPSIDSDDESHYDVVKDLEPEKIDDAPVTFTGNVRLQKPLKPFVIPPLTQIEPPKAVTGKLFVPPTEEEYKKLKEKELDLDALMQETADNLAEEVSTGDYEKTDELEHERADRKKIKVEEPRTAETQEDLGLTREFNFDKELKALRAQEAEKEKEETGKSGEVQGKAKKKAAGKAATEQSATEKTTEKADGKSAKSSEKEEKKGQVDLGVRLTAPVVDDYVFVRSLDIEGMEKPQEESIAEGIEAFLDNVSEQKQDGESGKEKTGAEAAEKEKTEEPAEAVKEEKAEKPAGASEEAKAEEPAETAQEEKAGKSAKAAEKARGEKSTEAAEKARGEESTEGTEKTMGEEPAETAKETETEESAEAVKEEKAEESAEAAKGTKTEESAEAVKEEKAEESAEAGKDTAEKRADQEKANAAKTRQAAEAVAEAAETGGAAETAADQAMKAGAAGAEAVKDAVSETGKAAGKAAEESVEKTAEMVREEAEAVVEAAETAKSTQGSGKSSRRRRKKGKAARLQEEQQKEETSRESSEASEQEQETAKTPEGETERKSAETSKAGETSEGAEESKTGETSEAAGVSKTGETSEAAGESKTGETPEAAGESKSGEEPEDGSRLESLEDEQKKTGSGKRHRDNRRKDKGKAGQASTDEAKKPEEEKKQPIRARRFTDEEKKVFSYFSQIPGIDMQVTAAMNAIIQNAGEKTSQKANIAIMGREGSGKTRLAESIIRAICKEMQLTAVKTARLDAADINEKDPAEIIGKLSGGFMIVEHASNLSTASIEGMEKAMDFRTDGLIVIIEDEKQEMNTMLKSNPSFGDKFTSRIVIPVFTNDELVIFARIYTKENGYRMDDMGTLALYTLIGDNQKDLEPISIGQVKDMIDTAMAHSQKFFVRLLRKLGKKQKDEDGMIILYEKDFDF